MAGLDAGVIVEEQKRIIQQQMAEAEQYKRQIENLLAAVVLLEDQVNELEAYIEGETHG